MTDNQNDEKTEETENDDPFEDLPPQKTEDRKLTEAEESEEKSEDDTDQQGFF